MIQQKHKLVISLSLLAALVLTGCAPQIEDAPFGENGDVPQSAVDIDCKSRPGDAPAEAITKEIAVVLAPTANFVALSKVIDKVAPDLRASVENDVTVVTSIRADGRPTQDIQKFTSVPSKSAESDREKEFLKANGVLRNSYACLVMTEDQNKTVRPSVDGSDLLTALRVASDSFSANANKKEIFVLSNGLQTIGQFTLNDKFPVDEGGIQNFVGDLQASNSLPDLKGATVNWYGLGQTDGVVQPQLSTLAARGLKSLWSQLIEAAGGKIGTIVESIPFEEPVATAIQVEPISTPEPTCLFVLDEADGFSFKPDSAEFVNAAAVEEKAKAIAESIKSQKCEGPLFVTGYAASGTSEASYDAKAKRAVQTISIKRASAFVALLKTNGVTIELQAIGGGRGPFNDWDESGEFVESLGKQNRFVQLSHARPLVK